MTLSQFHILFLVLGVFAVGTVPVSAFNLATAPTEDRSEKSEVTHSDHFILLNCQHDTVKNEGTGNMITIRWYDGSKLLATDTHNQSRTTFEIRGPLTKLDAEASDYRSAAPQCVGSDWAQYFMRAEGTPSHFTLTTDGDDGLFIDHVLYIGDKDGSSDEREVEFGRSNGKGWCLSLDRADATRGWKNYVNGCHKRLRFYINLGRVVSW